MKVNHHFVCIICWLIIPIGKQFLQKFCCPLGFEALTPVSLVALADSALQIVVTLTMTTWRPRLRTIVMMSFDLDFFWSYHSYSIVHDLCDACDIYHCSIVCDNYFIPSDKLTFLATVCISSQCHVFLSDWKPCLGVILYRLAKHL